MKTWQHITFYLDNEVVYFDDFFIEEINDLIADKIAFSAGINYDRYDSTLIN